MPKRRKPPFIVRRVPRKTRKLPVARSATAAEPARLRRARHLQAYARTLLHKIEKERQRGAHANRRLLRRLVNQRYQRMSAIERLLGIYRPRSKRLTASRKTSIRKAWTLAEKLLTGKPRREKKPFKFKTRRLARKSTAAKETRPPTARVSPLEQRKLQIALKALRADNSLNKAARDAQLPPATLRRLLEQTGFAEKRGDRWIVRNDVPRQMLLYSNGEAIVITVRDLKAAKIVGAYMAHVGQFLKSNDPAYLTFFRGHGIADANGIWHPFETDPDTLYRLASTGSESFEQVYRIVI